MIELKDLLGRFNDALFVGENKKQLIKNTIFQITKIEIDSKHIEIKNNIIYLNIKPIYKNEIFLKQEAIFIELQKTLGRKTPPTIR